MGPLRGLDPGAIDDAGFEGRQLGSYEPLWYPRRPRTGPFSLVSKRYCKYRTFQGSKHPCLQVCKYLFTSLLDYYSTTLVARHMHST